MKELLVSRFELYELVWSRPMRILAEEFDISDVGISKVCARNEIPTPPRGYWARREAGQNVRRSPLLKPTRNLPVQIKISGATSALPHTARQILAQAKIEKKSKKTLAPSRVTDSGFDNLHPVLLATSKVLRARKCDDKGAVQAVGNGLCGVTVSPDCTQRATGGMDRRRLKKAGNWESDAAVERYEHFELDEVAIAVRDIDTSDLDPSSD